MCTREITILTGILVVVVGVLASLTSHVDAFWSFRSAAVPAKSVLSNFSWDPAFADRRHINEEMLEEWETNGYAVLRKAVDPRAVGLLLEEAKRLCGRQFLVAKVCQVEEGRWQSDLIRDFLFYSNISEIAAGLLRDADSRSLRVYQDGIVGAKASWVTPLFFTFTKHVDHGGMPGIWQGLHSDTKGVGLWIPLVEMDPKVTGGSIEVFSGFPTSGCQYAAGQRSTVEGFDDTLNKELLVKNCPKQTADDRAVKLSVSPGDVVAWLPEMLHRTQPVLDKEFVRYALYVRLVTSDTMVCMQKDCGWKGRPCCAGPLPASGALISTPCYPQVWPKPLDEEVRAHFGKRPEPLIDRSRVENKYTSEVLGAMHKVCKKHRQGGPLAFWEKVKKIPPSVESERPPIQETTEFDCENAEHEGDCWVLDNTNLNMNEVASFPGLSEYLQLGIPLWFTKERSDMELMYRLPWGGQIRGVVENEWIRVGDYYCLRKFAGAELVLVSENKGSPASAPPTHSEL